MPKLKGLIGKGAVRKLSEREGKSQKLGPKQTLIDVAVVWSPWPIL